MDTKNKPQQIPELVERYLDNRCEPHETEAAKSWLCENINSSRFDVEFENILNSTTPSQDKESVQRSRKALERFINLESEIRRKNKRSKRVIIGIASTLVAATIICAAIIFNKEVTPVQWHEIYAQRGHSESIILPDGTLLQIGSGSKVLYPSHFDSDTRTIYIDGEVYADVAKDPQKPFIVSANDTRIKVHGTKFNVKAFAEMENVEVALICGSVTMEVCSNDKTFSRTLKPGEFIRYNKKDGSVENYNTNVAALEYGQGKNLRFINQSLEEIAKDLERQFNVRIFIEDEHLNQTQYYASFVNNEDLDQILNALNSNKAMKIRRKSNTIVISSNR